MVKVSFISLAVSAACLNGIEGFNSAGGSVPVIGIKAIQSQSSSRLFAVAEIETAIEEKTRPVFYAPRVFTTSNVESKFNDEKILVSDIAVEEPQAEVVNPEAILEQPIEETSAPITSAKPLDELLETSVLSQGISRKQRLEEVSSQLNKSIAAKKEAEQAIVKEIEEIRMKLTSELKEEILLRQEITGLSEDLETVISQKTVQLQEEEALLIQLQTVKTQVKEERIFAQIEDAANVKTELISIETIVIEDLKDCRNQMGDELQDTIRRIERIKNALEKLPEDVEASRAYSWEEVQELQNLLLDSIDTLQQRDMRIGILKKKFSDATEQKAIALGEIDVIADDSQLLSGVDGVTTIDSPAQPREVKVTITPDMTEQDILKLAGDSSKEAFQETGKALGKISNDLGSWVKSEEGQQSASELIDAIEASKKILPALSEAASSAKKEWDSKFIGEEMTTFDKLFKGIKSGFNAMRNSEDVKRALDTASENTKELTTKTSSASSKTFNAIKTTATDESVVMMLNEAVRNLQKSVISLAAAGTKFANKFQSDRLLPPPKN